MTVQDDDSALPQLSQFEIFVFYRVIPFGLTVLFFVASNVCVYDAATSSNLGYWWIVLAADIAALIAVYMALNGKSLSGW